GPALLKPPANVRCGRSRGTFRCQSAGICQRIRTGIGSSQPEPSLLVRPQGRVNGREDPADDQRHAEQANHHAYRQHDDGYGHRKSKHSHEEADDHCREATEHPRDILAESSSRALKPRHDRHQEQSACSPGWFAYSHAASRRGTALALRSGGRNLSPGLESHVMAEVRTKSLGRPVLYALVLLGVYLPYLVLSPVL